MSSSKRLMKEYSALRGLELPPNVVRLQPIETQEGEVDVHQWEGIISGPPDTPYEGGVWTLRMEVSSSYPTQPPTVTFKTPIIHPNINFETGAICLSLLDASAKDGGWSPAWNLLNATVAIVLLLSDPEPDSPLNVDAANLYRLDQCAYRSLVQYYVHKLASS